MPSSSSSLAFVLPEFSFEDAGNSRFPALERLIAYSREGVVATIPSSNNESWQAELFRALHINASSLPASAPTSWLGASGERDEATWLHADPVRLETAVDGMVLRTTRRWSASELDSVGELFAEHLHQTHMNWRVAGGRTFIRSVARLEARTVTPRQAANRSLRDSLPSGSDAAVLRRLMTELQMLLHEKFADPSAANAVWLWGAGSMDSVADKLSEESISLPRAWTNDDYARGFYSAHQAQDRCVDVPDALNAVLENRSERSLVVMRDRRLAELERNWFAPALHALNAKKLDSVELYFDGRSAISERSWIRRVFARPRKLLEISAGVDA